MSTHCEGQEPAPWVEHPQWRSQGRKLNLRDLKVSIRVNPAYHGPLQHPGPRWSSSGLSASDGSREGANTFHLNPRSERLSKTPQKKCELRTDHATDLSDIPDHAGHHLACPRMAVVRVRITSTFIWIHEIRKDVKQKKKSELGTDHARHGMPGPGRARVNIDLHEWDQKGTRARKKKRSRQACPPEW